MQVGFGVRVVRVFAVLGLLLGTLVVGDKAPAIAAVDCAIPTSGVAPVSTPIVATPIASAIAATPVSERDQLKTSLRDLVQVVSACKSAGDFQTMSRLVTEKYLGQVYGGGPRMSRETFLVIAETLPTPKIRFRAFDDLSIIGPGEARANVTLIAGNQLIFERLTFVEEKNRPGQWLIDSTEPLRVRPPRDHANVRITITGNRYSPDELTADNATVEIRASNSDKEDHELLVLKLDTGLTTHDVLTTPGPNLPDGARYIGQVTIPARESGTLVLVDLKPGTYTIVDLLPAANGVPHLAVGMEATLTITGE
jgi:hypothetical protein